MRAGDRLRPQGHRRFGDVERIDVNFDQQGIRDIDDIGRQRDLSSVRPGTDAGRRRNVSLALVAEATSACQRQNRGKADNELFGAESTMTHGRYSGTTDAAARKRGIPFSLSACLVRSLNFSSSGISGIIGRDLPLFERSSRIGSTATGQFWANLDVAAEGRIVIRMPRRGKRRGP